jgi:hypothetical protein
VRVLSTDVAEPNRLREVVVPKTMRWADSNSDSDGGSDVLVVEMEHVFVGWLEIQNISGAPGSTITINVSTVPFCSVRKRRFGPLLYMNNRITKTGSGRT